MDTRGIRRERDVHSTIHDQRDAERIENRLQASGEVEQRAGGQVLLAQLNEVNAAKGGLCRHLVQRPATRTVPVRHEAHHWQAHFRHGGCYRRTPSRGLLAVAYAFFGMRPPRYALRPARTPSAIASASSGGFSANATAEFTRQASAPISIASAAVEGAPSPASTTTGMFAFSMMILI